MEALKENRKKYLKELIESLDGELMEIERQKRKAETELFYLNNPESNPLNQ